eukprot:g16684.t1
MSLPWWRWRSIEKMHIDANFIYGHIPEDLPELWPNLRSLDLHDLKLSGPLPWSLRRLVNLTQLQVQLNDLYCPDGIDVVAGLMKMPKMRTFNIDANPTMCGCLPSKVPAHLRMQVGETAVKDEEALKSTIPPADGMAMKARKRGWGSPSLDDVESFIYENRLDQRAAAALERAPPVVQRSLLSQGQLHGNTSRECMAQIRAATSQEGRW